MSPATTARIANARADGNWVSLQPRLAANRSDRALWGSACDEYHLKRIHTRYIDPIDEIGRRNASLGDGFAVVALFCTLVEFLETTEQGLNFKADAPRNPYEYGPWESMLLLTSFLEKRLPFKSAFENQRRGSRSLAESFYMGVLCGVLHEARTTEGWLILNEGKMDLMTGLPDGTMTLHWNRLRPMLDIYLADYRTRLLTATATQDAFIRKWTHLCQP